jgi:toxin ParE1/3/4
MVKVNVSETAYNDLLSIEEFIFQDSPATARAFINKIFNKIEILHTFPVIGRVVPEFEDKNIRELLVGSYRIVYLIKDKDHVTILRIIHGSKLLGLI